MWVVYFLLGGEGFIEGSGVGRVYYDQVCDGCDVFWFYFL